MSKQWEDKSLQGRYANACRKTINRTGNRGVNGVRESLREILGRSPDPDEVYTEAHRDKGSRVKKEMKKRVSPKWANLAEDDTSEEDEVEQSPHKYREPAVTMKLLTSHNIAVHAWMIRSVYSPFHLTMVTPCMWCMSLWQN